MSSKTQKHETLFDSLTDAHHSALDALDPEGVVWDLRGVMELLRVLEPRIKIGSDNSFDAIYLLLRRLEHNTSALDGYFKKLGYT